MACNGQLTGNLGALFALDVDRVVALVEALQRVEEQAVRAEFFRRYFILALVELVTVYGIGVLAVLLRALESSRCSII